MHETERVRGKREHDPNVEREDWLAAERRGLVRVDAAFAVQVKNDRIVGRQP